MSRASERAVAPRPEPSRRPCSPTTIREAELAEAARLDAGSWDSVAPGKADRFGPSFRG